MSKIHKITKQKVKTFWFKLSVFERDTPFGAIHIVVFHGNNVGPSRTIARQYLLLISFGLKQRNTWWSNSSQWADISFEGNGKEIQYESVCNPWGNKDIWLVFLSLPPRYLCCHIFRLEFDLEIWNQAVPKQKSYFVKKMLRDHADILIIPAWIKPVENALKSGVNRGVSHWVLLQKSVCSYLYKRMGTSSRISIRISSCWTESLPCHIHARNRIG